MNIFDIGSPTFCYKVFNRGYSSDLGIKTILLQVLPVYFLLTRLSLGLPNSGHFCDMTNYILEPLAILEIHKDAIKEIYI